jgi:AraC-like DNA-binding protein
MLLQIRNMESNRCIMLVKKELNKLGLDHNTIKLGTVELKGKISDTYLQMLDMALKESGLEIIYNKESLLIEKIKDAISKLICLSSDFPKPSFSDYIINKVNHNYAYLSNLFSGMQGITIEKYIIAQKIERVKYLLVYSELTLNDIAFQLGYSSVAHLSTQFKRVTGLTASHFKQRRKTGSQTL